MRFHHQERELARSLLAAPIVKVGRWQSRDVGHIDVMDTPEFLISTIQMDIPPTVAELQEEVRPNLPWAENQFLERVSGQPLNPGETYREWPWFIGNVERHQTDERFSHTYMERFWPRNANGGGEWSHHVIDPIQYPHRGIRYKYGDFLDVLKLLHREPYTRQAYLPIFFPEDTGVVHGERVPCTLGYQFLMRDGRLHIIYHIRSCDFVRHFRDDVYMAARLAHHAIEVIQDMEIEQDPAHHAQYGGLWNGNDIHGQVVPGTLTMHIGSFHCFRGDLPKLKREYT